MRKFWNKSQDTVAAGLDFQKSKHWEEAPEAFLIDNIIVSRKEM